MQYSLDKPIYDDDEYSAFLSHLLDEALRQAEELFGQRDESFTIEGVFLIGSPTPYIQPIIIEEFNIKKVLIMLTRDCRHDLCQTVFQLTHEVIHCLFPKFITEGTFLEEGIATWFSFHFNYEGYKPTYSIHPLYTIAYSLAASLLHVDLAAIRRYRIFDPHLNNLSAPLLQSLVAESPFGLCNSLCLPFPYEKLQSQ